MQTLQSARALMSCRTSLSRTIIGPLVMMPVGFSMRAQRFERAARQLVVALDRLVAVGRGADDDVVARPRRLVQLGAEHFDEVRLHEDDRRELVVRAELELRVVAARVAVVAAVRAAAIRIQRPLERHPLDAVQRGAAADFLVSWRRRRGGSPRSARRRRRLSRGRRSAAWWVWVCRDRRRVGRFPWRIAGMFRLCSPAILVDPSVSRSSRFTDSGRPTTGSASLPDARCRASPAARHTCGSCCRRMSASSAARSTSRRGHRA